MKVFSKEETETAGAGSLWRKEGAG